MAGSELHITPKGRAWLDQFAAYRRDGALFLGRIPSSPDDLPTYTVTFRLPGEHGEGT